MKLDNWQKEVLAWKGDLLLCSGRQTGKSEVISLKAVERALKQANISILAIACTERQSEELLVKCLNHLEDIDPKSIKQGVDRPTKHIIKLINGSIIRCLPTGQSGRGIRCFTVDILIPDEAAFIHDDVYAAVTPMMLTRISEMWLVSTPQGRKGYFWNRYNDPSFKTFHVNSEEVMRDRPISESWTVEQRASALARLEKEKVSMTAKQYQQEYLGLFVEDISRMFSDDLIDKICTGERGVRHHVNNYYLGVDLARLGEDESTYEIVNKINKNSYVHVESMITKQERLTVPIDTIIHLERMWRFKQIYIDDAGVGSGVFDVLLREDSVKRKITAINNASRSLDRDDKQRVKLLKEDLYNNLLVLMEQGKVQLLDDEEVRLSLRSVLYEYIIKEGEPTKFKIYGRYTHISEGLIRACWCNKDKHLNMWCGSGRL